MIRAIVAAVVAIIAAVVALVGAVVAAIVALIGAVIAAIVAVIAAVVAPRDLHRRRGHLDHAVIARRIGARPRIRRGDATTQDAQGNEQIGELGTHCRVLLQEGIAARVPTTARAITVACTVGRPA
ncbi:MAG: hypothetical protein K8W52_15215 [Deltaproteobacteria bacterium]|nr:hypothetical protein [Deltaproteobacteria bacterium]